MLHFLNFTPVLLLQFYQEMRNFIFDCFFLAKISVQNQVNYLTIKPLRKGIYQTRHPTLDAKLNNKNSKQR